jgi:hypothetical protein
MFCNDIKDLVLKNLWANPPSRKFGVDDYTDY